MEGRDGGRGVEVPVGGWGREAMGAVLVASCLQASGYKSKRDGSAGRIMVGRVGEAGPFRLWEEKERDEKRTDTLKLAWWPFTIMHASPHHPSQQPGSLFLKGPPL